MKTSELISNLEHLIKRYGDLDIHVNHQENEDIVTHVHVDECIILAKDGSNSRGE